MTRREEVYQAIDSERAYQDTRWYKDTTASGGTHTVTEWLVFVQDYLTEAVHQSSRQPEPKASEDVLHTLRKIAAMCVACMEQNGAPPRKGFEK